MRRLATLVLGAFCAPALAGAIMVGEFDHFQDGTLEGWESGENNPNPPVNLADFGPGSAGDRAMVLSSTGSSGAGGKLVVFNADQWTGDYLTAGVNEIRMDLRNLSGMELTIRLALSSGATSFATQQSVVLPAGAGTYTPGSLSVRPEDLVLVSGAGDAATLLSNVTELRILHSTTPDVRGDSVSGGLAVDNIVAGAGGLQCSSGIGKADVPADFLLLPGFEVDTSNVAGVTTFFSVHNQTDEPRAARVRYFSPSGALRREDDFSLAARQTRTTNLRTVSGLPVEADGFVRGSVKVLACAAGAADLSSALSGDYLFLDNAGNFATGDQLLRREDVCQTVQVRLLNFGSGIRLRLYSTDPQGISTPTAMFTVFNEAGTEVDSGPLIVDEEVEVFNTAAITATSFGTLVVDFLAGGGALTVEYSAFGRFSVAMNAVCVTPLGD